MIAIGVLLLGIAVVYAQPMVNITEHSFDDALQTVVFTGNQSQLLFSLSVRGEVFRSADGGVTWESQSSRMPSFNETTRGITQIHPSPADETGQHVLFVSADNLNWHTQDGGETYELFDTLVRSEEILMHPTLVNVVAMLSFHPNCFNGSMSSGQVDGIACHDRAYITYDFGATWTQFEEYVHTIEFGEHAVDENGDAFIIVSSFKERQGPQGSLDPTEQRLWRFDSNPEGGEEVFAGVGFYRHLLLDHSFGVVFLESFLFAVSKDTTAEPGTQNELPMLLWASTDGGLSMREARFPVELTTLSQITIIDQAAAIVMALWVNRVDTFGAVFSSDSDGLEYVQLLERCRRYARHSYDYYNVQGVDGVLYANQINLQATGAIMLQYTTVMTTDQGATWRPLLIPETDLTGEPYDCTQSTEAGDGGCSLHIQLNRQYRPVTNAAAVGVVLAHGNVGDVASPLFFDWQPFMSRDAGSTWRPTVQKDVFHAELGAHGAVIVLAEQERTSSKLRYTLNEGLTWVELDDRYEALEVQNIYHHRALETEEFILRGVRADNRGALVRIDFSPLRLRECRGHDTPGAADSDYELYTPSTTADGCLLGRRVQYVRRRQGVECADFADSETKILSDVCECTRADYECDFGYTRDASGDCVAGRFAMELDTRSIQEQCAEVGATTYYSTMGYRKEPGNQCEGGLDIDRVSKPCPDPNAPSTSSSGTSTTTSTTSARTTTTAAAQEPTSRSALATTNNDGATTDAVVREPDVAPRKSGPGAGVIVIVVLVILLCLLLICYMVVRRRRNSYEVHGVDEGGRDSTPMADTAEMDLESDSD